MLFFPAFKIPLKSTEFAPPTPFTPDSGCACIIPSNFWILFSLIYLQFINLSDTHSISGLPKPAYKAGISSPALVFTTETVQPKNVPTISATVLHCGLLLHFMWIRLMPNISLPLNVCMGSWDDLRCLFQSHGLLYWCAISLQADTWYRADPCQTMVHATLASPCYKQQGKLSLRLSNAVPLPTPNSRLKNNIFNFLQRANVGSTTVI